MSRGFIIIMSLLGTFIATAFIQVAIRDNEQKELKEKEQKALQVEADKINKKKIDLLLNKIPNISDDDWIFLRNSISQISRDAPEYNEAQEKLPLITKKFEDIRIKRNKERNRQSAFARERDDRKNKLIADSNRITVANAKEVMNSLNGIANVYEEADWLVVEFGEYFYPYDINGRLNAIRSIAYADSVLTGKNRIIYFYNPGRKLIADTVNGVVLK